MIVKMKAYEKKCVEYSKRYKGWDASCVSKDSYLAGYKQALADLEEVINADYEIEYVLNNFITQMEESASIEFKDGEHQLLNNAPSEN